MANPFVLHREQVLDAPLDEVFRFFATPENLEQITPPFLRFAIRTPKPIEMRQGLLIEYQIRLRGFPMRWISEITRYAPPHHFVDRQVRGPYRSWEHEHRFVAENGATRVIDHIRYEVLGGRLVNQLFVARDLAAVFDYRRRVLEDRFGTRS